MFLLWSLQAAADLAPPLEYIKPCTVAAWCDDGEEGLTCTESSVDTAACTSLTEQGYSRRCRGELGADGLWQVVLCRTRTEHTEPETTAPPADAPGTVLPPSPRRCAAVAGGGGLAALLALAPILRRRRND